MTERKRYRAVEGRKQVLRAKNNGRFRQYGIWLRLLMKRLWHQPAYVVLLLLIPILGLAVGRMEQSERGAGVAVCVEAGAWSGQITAGLQELSKDSILRFDFCHEAADAERSVMRGEADCGFVIAGDIRDRVMDRDWAGSVTVYETPASSITGMAKERICSVIFKLYSEQCYEAYMHRAADKMVESEGFVLESGETGNAIGNEEDDNAITDENIRNFTEYAWRAYESHLADDSTFGFRYMGSDLKGQYTSDTDVISDTAVFPVKGVFAVIIFIGGMCGMLEYDTDRREKRFVRMAPNILTYIVDIWMPTVFISMAALLCLWVSEGLFPGGSTAGTGRLSGLLSVWSAGMWMRQAGRLLLYQGTVVIYCSLLGVVLRRREAIASAIPVLSVGSLVCAPVFVRLGSYVPVFAVLEKFFPVTYYLL